MLKRYQEFLKEFDGFLDSAFENQKQYIKCQKGCSACCELGDYPFSRLEMEYLMAGFQTLPKDIRNKVKDNISNAKNLKEYKCPFLIENLCCLYERRGIVCRTHGLAYLHEGKMKLPKCAENGLNYSEVFDKTTGEIVIDNPIKENLRIDAVLKSPLARNYQLEPGEIRRLVDWF